MAGYLYDPAEETPAPPLGVLVAGHYTEPYGYYAHRSTGTKDWLITYTLGGVGCYVVDGDVMTCRAGDVVILPPGVPHHYATAEGETWDFLWAHFLPRHSWTEWLQRLRGVERVIVTHVEEMSVRERIEAAFRRTLRDSLGMGRYSDELALNGLEEVILVLVQHVPTAAANTIDPRVTEVLQYLSEHMTDQISIADLARRVCLSPSRLSHLFKEQVNDSILNMLLKIRLRQAARLLEYTSRKVADIAQDVGFHSAFYFSRKFAAYYGMSPSEYRRRAAAREGVRPQGDEEK